MEAVLKIKGLIVNYNQHVIYYDSKTTDHKYKESPTVRDLIIFSQLATSSGQNELDAFMQAAFEEAKKGRAEGGIPIGSVLVRDGKIIGRGHNQRV